MELFEQLEQFSGQTLIKNKNIYVNMKNKYLNSTNTYLTIIWAY